MKTILTLFALLLTVHASAQQLETYNSGVLYNDILEPTNGFMFDQSSGNGIGAGGAMIAASDAMLVNYFRRGPFDFTVPGCVFQISTMFQIRAPVDTGLSGGLQIGFVQSQSGQSFISPGNNNDMSLWIYPISATPTGGGYKFQETIDFNLYTGSSSSGDGFGTSTQPILKTGEWYMATLSVTRVNSTTLTLFSTINDFGTTGSNYVSQVDSLYVQNVTGPSGYPFSSLTSISQFFPAIAAGMDYGIKVVDNTAISAPMSANEGVSEKTDFELDFPTLTGHQYFIQASPDMIQWKVVETVSGTGLGMVRYYPLSSGNQFFKVVQD